MLPPATLFRPGPLTQGTGRQTPEATLSAAMHREINAQGDDARFIKTDRGLFAYNEKAKP